MAECPEVAECPDVWEVPDWPDVTDDVVTFDVSDLVDSVSESSAYLSLFSRR